MDAKRRYDKARDQTQDRQYIHSPMWRTLRLMKLNRNPLCERHLARGETVAATLVHHKDGNELNNADDNHVSLCNPCHEEIERKGRWGR